MAAWDYVGIILCAVMLSVLVIFVASRLTAEKPVIMQAKPEAARFLFRSDQLVNHNLEEFEHDLSVAAQLQTWGDFKKWIGSRFGTLLDTLEKQPLQNIEILKELDGKATLTICSNSDGHHVTLTDPSSYSPAVKHQQLNNDKSHKSLETAIDRAPFAILQINKESNQRRENALWKRFSIEEKAELEQPLSDMLKSEMSGPKQISFNHSTSQKWLELSVQDTGDDWLCYTTDISDLVEAKNAQRAFLQTLTKTFANLSTGLCVFDRDHRMVLFNPALVNLTKLPIDFLSARPNLMSFFDKLRDLQMMPEPKNYSAWRIQINQMIASAIGGLYDETWALPSGLTYRITGRPHPDGAVAFLIENITDDVVLTHRYRAQIDMRQSALDSLDDAIAVFSQGKSLLFCNAALARLINFDPDQSITEITPKDLIARCESSTAYKADWSAITSKLMESRLQGSYSKLFRNKNALDLHCQISPLSGNQTMLKLSFQKRSETKVPQPEIA
ncbi:Sensor protein DivL [Roseovarius albus]|uniref:Sensor protein DivL n=1 Tax=Roseovarius albus TaxID=1247867 RepID=A0A1X6Z6N5_9RHOB|nr:PAS-domain containing protein [Roseovarius albus]SLN40346.1 Sensor protein DivL [Roseovarius albus]